MSKIPEESDLVSVVIKQVEYFGYINYVSFDVRNLGVEVEFFPGVGHWFAFDEIKFIEYPKEIK